MSRTVFALVFSALTLPAWAQMTPVGLWRTIDDNTGELSSEVRIAERVGALHGSVEKLLRKDAKQDSVCDKCSDERKDKRVLGMEIIRGAKQTVGSGLWEGGKILDPDNGKEYTLRLTPVEGGKKLEVRGYIAFFYRTQTWIRVQ